MAEYNPEISLQRLDFDFGVDGPRGTIPDPSRELVVAFDAALAGGSDWAQQLDALVAICAGSISRDELERLPFRRVVGFMRWLHDQLHAPPVLARIAGITAELKDPVLESWVRRLAGHIVEGLGLQDEDEINRVCNWPLAKAFNEGARWGTDELVRQLRAAGFDVTLRTTDDEARDLLSQIDFGSVED